MKIAGKVIDKKTGEPIPYANVFFSKRNGTIGYSNEGTITNDFGKYKLDWPADLWLTASATGYKKVTLPLPEEYDGTQIVDFELEPGVDLPEIEIIASPVKIKKTYYWYFVALMALVGVLWYFSVKRV